MPGLGVERLAVAAALASFGPHPYPAVTTLARMVMLSASRARAGIKMLEGRGFLTSAGRFNASRVYAFASSDVPPILIPRRVIDIGETLGAEGVAIGVLLAVDGAGRSVQAISTCLGMKPARVRAIARELWTAHIVSDDLDALVLLRGN